MDNIASIYKDMIIDLYKNPLNKKVLSHYDKKQQGINPGCGDEVEIMVQFDDAGRVLDIGYTGQGCAISQAALSLLTEEVKGKSKEEVEKMTKEDMYGLLGIPISYTREKCALLGLKTIQRLLNENTDHQDFQD